MISRIDLRGALPENLRDVLPRAELDVEAALAKVRPICEDVHHRGVAAIRELTARFDGVEIESTRVPAEAIARALEELDPGSARPWRSPSAAPAWSTATSAAPTSPPRSCPAAPSPSAGSPSIAWGSTSPAARRSTRPAWS
nr:hypothetical protein GCM10020093_115550 [Planobispora longispora]